MLRVSRQPELPEQPSTGRHGELRPELFAWAPVVEAAARGGHVSLRQVDRALNAIFMARREPGETDADACARLMRSDREVRVLLNERGTIVGSPIELPAFEPVLIDVPPRDERRGSPSEIALATGAIRRHVHANRAEGEGYHDTKARLVANKDPELVLLQRDVRARQEEREKCRP
jgi:hypothetical protein